MAGHGTYTAETLAFRAGLPVRTVRFYVQERLIDPPLGRGRGAHFTDHHLVQLQQARTLHNSGVPLEAIRERRGDLTLGLQVVERWDAVRRSWSGAGRASTDAEEGELNPSDCLRIPVADGVELLISNDRPLPSPRELVEVAFLVRKVFGRR
jgi:hypothetical protein